MVGAGFFQNWEIGGTRGNTRSWPFFQEKNCKDGLREDEKSDGTRERLMDWRALRGSKKRNRPKKASRKIGDQGRKVGF